MDLFASAKLAQKRESQARAAGSAAGRFARATNYLRQFTAQARAYR